MGATTEGVAEVVGGTTTEGVTGEGGVGVGVGGATVTTTAGSTRLSSYCLFSYFTS